MTTLEYLTARWGLTSLEGPYPIQIKNAVRTDLGPMFADLGFTKGAEIGVWKGLFSEVLLRANPKLHMLCVDPWTAYKDYLDHTRQDLMAEAYESAVHRLSRYHATIVRKFSGEAVKDVPDGSLDFVYIDGNHSFLDCAQDLTWWSKKVRSGGIVSGHDYYPFPPKMNMHVIEAVHGFTEANYIAPWFVLGRRKVVRGERWEKERSFLWVKP